MISIVKTISTAFDSFTRRITKIRRFGKEDVQTAVESSPYGTDSNPVAGMEAIFSQSTNKGRKVIIGYINTKQLAAVGEHRTYATDENGNIKFYIWQKNNGTLLLGGDAKHIANYEGLQQAFDQLKADFNDHISAYNIHTHAGVTTGGGITGITTPGTESSADITPAKNDKIKTL